MRLWPFRSKQGTYPLMLVLQNMPKQTQTIVLEAILSEEQMFPASLSMRVYFSSYHRWAMDYFAKRATETEKTDTAERFDIQQRAYVTGAVFSSVAFLEAAVNEFCKDAAEGESAALAVLSPNSRQNLKEFWSNERKFPILAKYQKVLTLCGKNEFPKDRNPYQNAGLVIKLRNELTHYKPGTYGGTVQHDFKKQFKGRFEENPLMVESKNPYFPDKCLGSPCAHWAAKTAQAVADAFFEKIGYTPNYLRLKF
jgi:hypothetical protein